MPPAERELPDLPPPRFIPPTLSNADLNFPQYNGYIIICIFIGAGLGKFVCDWMAKTVVVVGGGNGSKCVSTGPQSVGIVEPSVCCG